MLSMPAVRPPFVEFKMVVVDDRAATLQKGVRVTKDVPFAFVMQPGSKDCVERVAEEWLASIKRKSLDGSPDAYPTEWIEAFHKKYEMWRAGLEAPLNGTSVRQWPLLSPSQAENFVSLGIPTIEDVAAMTEDAMRRFGLGAREYRDKAREWVQGAAINEATTKENVELKEQLQKALDMVAAMNERLAQLESAPQIAPDAIEVKRRPGRPPRQPAAQ